MILLRERGTSAGAIKGWETRRRGHSRPQTPKDYRRVGRKLLGLPYNKLPRGQRAVSVSKLLTPKGRTKSEKQVERYLRKLGLVKNPQMGLGVGLPTESGTVKHTLMSNNRKYLFTGPVLGMRQKLMSWHKKLGAKLPSGFENWHGGQIETMFREWDRKSSFMRKLRAYTKEVK